MSYFYENKWHYHIIFYAKMALTIKIICQNGTKIFTIMPKNDILYLVIDMCLKEYRMNLGITLAEASSAVNVPIRTYIRYENDDSYGNVLKRNSIIEILKNKFEITEEKGILSIEKIKYIANFVFEKYGDKIKFCYLFGSYAKGYAKDNSDIDLCISTSLKGLEFVGLIEELRENLKKKIDLLRLADLKDNLDVINEIMKDGIRIYG